ncbi:MAG: tRNA 2-selenouridine(34) synthase MnmH [Ichthyobacteriaceae bacterium]|nr:tRNA 2-selenouridine(34) synthase MnmH [Ichthyobacteriaceae bacterium]
MTQRITVQEYYSNYSDLEIVDVRSPGEFKQGHIPGAHNIALFSNDERAHVGTVYKKQSQEEAIKVGYTYVNPKLDFFINESFKVAGGKTIVVHCWRGGMRSESFANHLAENGFEKVYIIEGGYKAFRNYVLSYFENDFKIKVLGGYTGSGKTDVLKVLLNKEKQVIDLEGLANHKGSAFGAIGEEEQPSVEHFENSLCIELQKLNVNEFIWLEDESLNIGKVRIPNAFFKQMSNQMVYFMDIPVLERAKYLVGTYGLFDKDKLEESLMKIEKRIGNDRAKIAIEALRNNDLLTVAEITLKYYDKAYLHGVTKRDEDKVIRIDINTVDAEFNANILMNLE